MKNPTTIASAVTGLPIAEITPPLGGGGVTTYREDGTPTAIGAPVGDSDSDLAIRCHEYGHLLLREVQHAVSLTDYVNPVQQAVMDVHTNAWLLAKKVPAVSHLPLHEPIRVRDGNVNLADRILCAFRSYGLAEPPPVRLPRPLRKRVVAVQRLAARARTAEQLIDACRQLQDILIDPDSPATVPIPIEPGVGKPGRTDADGPVIEVEDTGSGDDYVDRDAPGASRTPDSAPESDCSGDSFKEIMDKLEAAKQARIRKEERAKGSVPEGPVFPLAKQDMDYRHPKWMSMEVSHPPLEKRPKATRDYGRALRPGYVGALRYPLRALPGVGDGRVFGAVASGKRGTVLIDFSGSMELNPADIARVLAECPRMTIATYCGAAKANHGELRIVAHQGRVAAEITRYGKANGVDGPALQWLIRQPGPRFWVCDGNVTGLRDQSASVLTEQCRALVTGHGIHCYVSLGSFLARARRK